MTSQFPRPKMACGRCYKDWDTHGKYCHPIEDRIIIGVFIFLILSVFVLEISILLHVCGFI